MNNFPPNFSWTSPNPEMISWETKKTESLTFRSFFRNQLKFPSWLIIKLVEYLWNDFCGKQGRFIFQCQKIFPRAGTNHNTGCCCFQQDVGKLGTRLWDAEVVAASITIDCAHYTPLHTQSHTEPRHSTLKRTPNCRINFKRKMLTFGSR